MKSGVSIIISIHNSETPIQRVIDSVLAQKYSPCQLIVVDGCATNGMRTAVEPYGDKVEYFRQASCGSVAAYNLGLQMAQHEFVFFLDANDLLLPNKLQQQAALLQLRPSLGYVVSGWQTENDDPPIIAPWKLSPQPDLAWWLRFRPFPLSVILFRRLWLNSVAGFDEAAGLAYVHELMLRLYLAGATGTWLDRPTICLPKPAAEEQPELAEATMAALNTFFARPHLPDGLKAKQGEITFDTTLNMAWALFEQGETETAPTSSRGQAVSASLNAGVSILQKNAAQAQLSPEILVTAWLVHFEQWRQENGRSAELFSTFLPHLKAAVPAITHWPELHRLASWWLDAHPESVRSAFTPRRLWHIFKLGLDWEQQDSMVTAEDGLMWWAAIWQPYCQRPFNDAAPNWTPFSALDQYRLLDLVRFGLTIASEEMTAVRLSHLWQDAVAHGLLTESDFDQSAYFARLPTIRLPKVSVIVPVYNGANNIAETVASVLSQTYTDLELIVVDDGSTDGTVERLRPFHGQIRLIQQENQGVSAARNHGLNLALGEFILFLDGDDLLLPDKLAKQVACLEENHLLGAVHSGWQLVDEYGRPIRNITPWNNAPDLTLQEWLRWKPVFLGAMLFRRHWLRRIDGFDIGLRQAEDTDYLLRLSLAGCPMAWLKETTIHYRQHANGVTQNGRRQAKDLSHVLNRFFGRDNLPAHIQQVEPTVRRYTLIWLVWQLYRTNYHEEIVPYLQEAAQRMAHEETAPSASNLGGYSGQAVSAEAIAQSWLVQFASYAWDSGVPLAQLTDLFPHFQQALRLENGAWQQLETLLHWWLAQWEQLHQGHWGNLAQVQKIVHSGLYLEKNGHVSSALEWVEWWLTVWRLFLISQEDQADQGIQQFKEKLPPEIIRLAQASILHDPNWVSVKNIAAFWSKAQTGGLLPMEARHKISTLYLTYFGQALLGKRWKRAAIGLGRALRHSWHPQGMQAWWHFLIEGIRYFTE